MNVPVQKDHTHSRRRTRGARRWAGAALGAMPALLVGACEAREEGELELGMALVEAAQVDETFASIPQDGDTLGDPAAPVTLVDMSDLRCTHCKGFVLRVVPALLERYVRTGRLRIVFKNVPILGPPSERAARAAIAAGLQGRMFPFVDAAFANQGTAGALQVTDAFLRRIASSVPGLDVERLMVDRSLSVVTEQLAQNMRAARERKIQAVPSFLIGRTGEELQALKVSKHGDPASFIGPIEAALAPR